MVFYWLICQKSLILVKYLSMTKEERREKREKRQEIREQNKEFIERLRPLIAKKYRTSMHYEDSLMDENGTVYVDVTMEWPFSAHQRPSSAVRWK